MKNIACLVNICLHVQMIDDHKRFGQKYAKTRLHILITQQTQL